MKVQCPGCDFEGQADRSKIPPMGARVKCPKCGGLIIVKPPAQEIVAPLQAAENVQSSLTDTPASLETQEQSAPEVPPLQAQSPEPSGQANQQPQDAMALEQPAPNTASPGLSFKGPPLRPAAAAPEAHMDSPPSGSGQPNPGIGRPVPGNAAATPGSGRQPRPGGEVVSRFTSENAGLWARFAARLLDGALFLLFFMIVVKPIYFKMAFNAFNEWASSPEITEFLNSQQQPTLPDMSSMAGSITSALAVAQLLSWGFLLIYYIFFTGRFGATPGKMILGLRVKDSNDDDIGYLKAFGRFLADFILMPFTLGIGYLVAIFNEDKKGLHDMIAGTHVVRA